MKFNLLDIEQNTEEWFLFRSQGVGASESSVLMGMNPYETVENLYLKKINSPQCEEKIINDAILHGIRHEDTVRQEINLRAGSDFQPACVINEEFPFIRSSLDGIWNNKMLEIKCPINKYSFYTHCKKIPPYYYCQIQHHMLTTGLSEEYFVSWFEGKMVGYRVEQNLEFMLELKNRLIYFWNCVQEKKEPDYVRFRKNTEICR